MDISARSYLAAGISLTAATAIAFAPLAVPPSHHTDIRLTATPAEVAGLPGQALIGVVDNIVTLIDVVFTGAIDATEDPTVAASLTILETLSSDAFAKLAENLRLANDVITSTTEEVVTLLTTALTGSPHDHAGGQLVAENVLRAVLAVGQAAFELVEIAVSEVTFQVHNLATGLGALVNQLGQAASTPPDDAKVSLAATEVDEVEDSEEPVDGAEESEDAAAEDVAAEQDSVLEEPMLEESVPEESVLEEAVLEEAVLEESTPEEEPTQADQSAPEDDTPAPSEDAPSEDARSEDDSDETGVSPAESR